MFRIPWNYILRHSLSKVSCIDLAATFGHYIIILYSYSNLGALSWCVKLGFLPYHITFYNLLLDIRIDGKCHPQFFGFFSSFHCLLQIQYLGLFRASLLSFLLLIGIYQGFCLDLRLLTKHVPIGHWSFKVGRIPYKNAHYDFKLDPFRLVIMELLLLDQGFGFFTQIGSPHQLIVGEW